MSNEITHSPAEFPDGEIEILTLDGSEVITTERRALACLRACKGIPTEALESGALEKALEWAGTVAPFSRGLDDALRALGRIGQ